MGMQTDVKATKVLAATGVFKNQNDANVPRCRIKGVYFVSGTNAGLVTITDAQGGDVLLPVPTPAASTLGSQYIELPGEGILASNGLYATIANTASVVVIYG